MKFTSAGGVSIFELVFWFPAIVVAAIVCKKHGFGRSSGFVFTLILAVIRVIGACCQLATYQSPTVGLFEAVVILESIGISPLLFATLGLLSRCADELNATSKAIFSAIHFRALQLLILISLILSIVGGTSSYSNGVYTPQTTTKAALALYLLAFIAICAVTAIALSKSSYNTAEDRWLLRAVIIALPFVFVRILYSLLSVYIHSHLFNLITGSVGVHLGMAVLEEMIVVCIYLAVGWKVSPSATQEPIVSRPWKDNLNGAGKSQPSGRGYGRTRRQGPIHALVGAGIDAARHHGESKV